MSYTKYKCPDKAIQKKIDALPKLNPKAKKLWVDALLSGEYKQGRDRLKDAKKATYCCLGVATDVAVKGGYVGGSFAHGCYIHPDFTGFEDMLLPRPVAIWLGVTGNTDVVWKKFPNDMVVYYDGQRTSLSALNDINKLDFEMIAGVIINQL